MGAAEASDNDFSTSKNLSLIDRSSKEGCDSCLVGELRSRLQGKFSASAKRPGVGTKAPKGIMAETGLFGRSFKELCSSGLEEAVTRGMQV